MLGHTRDALEEPALAYSAAEEAFYKRASCPCANRLAALPAVPPLHVSSSWKPQTFSVVGVLVFDALKAFP